MSVQTKLYQEVAYIVEMKLQELKNNINKMIVASKHKING